MQLKSITGTCYVPAAVAPAVPAIPLPASAPGETSSAAGTSSDIGGIPMVLQPPVLHHYPSLSAALGQNIVDAFGRKRSSQALEILKAFDESTSKAQSYVSEASRLMTIGNDLMQKAHQECFSGMQKLLADQQAKRVARNESRRGRQKEKKQKKGAGIFFVAVSHVFILQLAVSHVVIASVFVLQLVCSL